FARGVIAGTAGADQLCKEFLGLTGSRVAAAYADFLTRWRGHNLEPGGTRKPDHRVAVGIVHPSRAAIKGDRESRNVGETAAADPSCRLHHDHLAVRSHDAPRRSDTRSTCADHDNVGLTRHRSPKGARAYHRRRRKCRGGREKAAARHCHAMVSGDLKRIEQLANFAVTGNTHGESIMIDRRPCMNQIATAFDHDMQGKSGQKRLLRGIAIMGVVLDTVGKLIGGYLQTEVPCYEPFTPSDPG